MEYRSLGRSGLKVSRLCLGTMMFGGATDDATAVRIVARAKDQGVNFIDSADGYNGGKSEEAVGRAIRDNRAWWVLATKCANPTGQGPNARGLSRRHMQHAVEASLRRLGVAEIDVLYLHKEDHSTPLAETVRALADLIRAGKIRYFGVSNYRSWRVAEICRLCDEAGIDRPVASQPLYNALNREVETEHLPAWGCADGEIRARCASAGWDAGGTPGPADAGVRMAAGEPAYCPGDRGACPGEGGLPGAVRVCLGAQQSARDRGDWRTEDGGAVGGLCRGDVGTAGCEGRGVDRPNGVSGASVDAGV
jgi:hypothetical protein